MKRGKKIFDDSFWDNVIDLGKLRGAQYSSRNLRRELKRVFGDRRLRDLKKRVLVTAFDLDNEADKKKDRTWKPKIFHNFPGRDSDGTESLFKVGVYTAAAPTYFPSEDGYVDGGVYAPNPSMCALAQSQDPRFGDVPKLSEVVLLSLGTGISLQYIKGRTLDWGYVQWIKPLISLMLDGVMGIADYQCKQMLQDRYNRLAPVFPPGVRIPMDGVKDVPYMIDFASSLKLDDTVAWLKAHWM